MLVATRQSQPTEETSRLKAQETILRHLSHQQKMYPILTNPLFIKLVPETCQEWIV